MKIELGIDDADIKTIRELRCIADVNCMEYEKEEENDAVYGKWIFRQRLFSKMEALIDNQLAETAPITIPVQDLKETSPIWVFYQNLPLFPVQVEKFMSIEDIARQHNYCIEDMEALTFKILFTECELQDYEETNLSPDEIINIKESYQKKFQEAECQDENLTVMEVWNLAKQLVEDRHLQIKEFEIKYGQKTITDVFENCTPQDVKDNVTRWKGQKKETSKCDVEKELNLLEEFLLAEREKTRREDLPETERKVAEERADSLIKIMKIVNTESHALTNDDRKNLVLIIERLLDESASAHVRQDADGEIEVMVYDSIYRKPLATLEIKKVCDCLDFESFHFYE